MSSFRVGNSTRRLRPRWRHYRGPPQPTPERFYLNGIDCPEKGQARTCLTQDSNCTLRKSLNFEAPFLKTGMLQIDKELQKDGVVDLVD